MNTLSPALLNRLTEILTRVVLLDTYQQRVAFLEASGLNALQPHLEFNADAYQFAHELIRDAQLTGNFGAGGEPAYFMLLAHVRSLIAGHPDAVDFIEQLYREATPPATRADTLPPPSPDFTGRDAERQRAAQALERGRAVVITGMGGIGKSDLARQIVQDVRAAYPGPAIQVELQPDNRPVSATELLGTLIVALAPGRSPPDTLPERLEQLRLLMAQSKGLLLLDNVAAHAQIHALETIWHGWGILITSRTRFVVRGSLLVRLTPLEKEDAEALVAALTANYGRDLTPAEAAQVAAACRNHPLALHVASAYLGDQSHHTVAHYLARVTSEPMAALSTDEYADVSAVLGFSVADLYRANPALYERWYLLALLPDPFDTSTAAATWGGLNEEETVVTPLDGESAQQQIDDLVRVSLLDFIPATDGGAVRYYVHGFFNDYLLRVAPWHPAADVQEAALRCHALTVLEMGVAAQHRFWEGKPVEGLRQFDLIWNHLNGAWQRLQNAQTPFSYRFLDSFVIGMIELLVARLSPRALLAYQEIALEAARALNNRSNEANHLVEIGNRHLALGNPARAIEEYKQARQHFSALNDRIGEGSTLGALGNAYSDSGDTPTAITHYEEALAIAREQEDRQNEGRWLGNIGTAYVELEETEKALEYFEQALEIARATDDYINIGHQLDNMGDGYLQLNDPHAAIPHLNDALTIFVTFGLKRQEGIVRWNLARAYRLAGARAQALEYARAALALYEETEYVEQAAVRTYIAGWLTEENGAPLAPP